MHQLTAVCTSKNCYRKCKFATGNRN